jgi:hypothetical protein
MKFKTDSAAIEHKVALLELQVLDVQTYAAQEKIRAMTKYLTNPKVRNKSSYGLMLQASLQEPTPDTISSDYFLTMQATYPELVALSHIHTQPLRKQDIQFHTSLSFYTNLIESALHTTTMKTYINNRLYETRDYLLHAKKFFALEEATTSLANFRIGASHPLSTLAAKGKIPHNYTINCHFCSANIANKGTIDNQKVGSNYHDLFECTHFHSQRSLIQDIISEILQLTQYSPTTTPANRAKTPSKPPHAVTARIPMLLGRPNHSNNNHTDTHFLPNWTPSTWPANPIHYKTNNTIPPPYIRIAKFLHAIHLTRVAAFDKLHCLQQES